MNPHKPKKVTTLQKHLFYRGQVYFQILAACALVIGTIVLGWIFHHFQIPDYFFKIVLLVGFSLTLMVIGLQAYLQHKIVSEAVNPMSWLSKELNDLLAAINNQKSSEPANIPALGEGIEKLLSVLEGRTIQQQELKDLAQTLRHLIDLLRNYWQAATRNEVLAAMGRVSAGVAHDIRSPLSSMEVALQNLRSVESADAQIQASLNLLELSRNRLAGIADNLLQKYKGEAEAKTSFSIHQILDELVGEYYLQERFGAVKFVRQYHANDLHIDGNRQLIQRIFSNLIKNGIESMQAVGSITITTEKKESVIVVTVADTGCGIPKNRLEQIFNGHTEGKKEGYGIGLQFVKKTVMDHGGEIRVESVFGEGTQFFIQLPISETAVETFTIQTAPSKQILVLDDDPSMLEQWRMILVKEGITVEILLCYEEFVHRQAQDERVNGGTAVIDYHFENSELNGIEIIKKLKEKGFENLYLCTAEYWKPSLKKQAQELGVSICPKPLPKIMVCHPERSEGSRLHRDSSPTAQNDKNGPRNDNRGYTILVIDDDSIIRLSWEMMREKLHVETLHAFASLESLQAANIDLKTIDIAFVDKNIENSAFDGAQVIDFLKIKGVSKVVLASGENEEELREDPKFAQADFVISTKVPTSFKAFLS